MMKNKKELYEENIRLRNYLNFWLGINDDDLDIETIEFEFINKKNKLRTIKKVIISLTIIFLCLSCYIVGLMGWNNGRFKGKNNSISCY